MKKTFFFLSICFISAFAKAQNTTYWQQHVDYTMDVDMNVDDYNYTGTQKLVYTNNSPDTLNQVFYHLYFNAFQPGSEMDVRSRSIADPDGRVMDRISKLSESEIGFLKVNKLNQDGKDLDYEVAGTVLEVQLAKPVLPGKSTTFEMDFHGQVPVQIRRSGRNNAEGVALSMTQWYPKLAEYDYQGWHADPYIGREFYGVWGDFDVKITLDKNYTVGGTGYLQNAEAMGHGYAGSDMKPGKAKKGKLTWHFKAPKVHDFTWAADPEYAHDVIDAENGVKLHFFYKNKPEIAENWKKLQPKTAELLSFYNKNVGQYPYEQYSVIQGGDGGMEYAMCTLITGERKFGSLVGVTAHEMAHTWFQFLLATDETKNEWMDEGFTTYISSEAMKEIMDQEGDPQAGNYESYFKLAKSGFEQPQTTNADRYDRNAAYGASAYSKGAVFLAQLGYIIGKENLDKTLHNYFNDFKFKHPNPQNIIRTAERVSGMQLDWYLTDWTETTNTIDYTVKEVKATEGGKTEITLERKGLMPMPIDLYVTSNGKENSYYIPLRMMRAEKENPNPDMERMVEEDWPWSMPTYTFTIDTDYNNISKVMIDQEERMADLDRSNNSWSKS